MLSYQLFLQVLLFELTAGTPHCSIRDTDVHCHPCTDICNPKLDKCFKCPKQCDSTANIDSCSSVCSDLCVDKACEYVNANLKCSEGCEEGRTGSYCQEFCPEDCVACDQHTSLCTSCKAGHNTCTLKGLGLCSVSDTNVRCLPCSEICNPKVNTCFSCPIQCGTSVDRCDSVCNVNCLHGRCEYDNGKLKCSDGCENGRTGISCQEFCAPRCKTCDQYSSACTQCESGDGENCTEVTKPICFGGCPGSSINEIQCKVIKHNVCKEHSGCLTLKTENTSDCNENIKEILNISSCSFECVHHLCSHFLNFDNCTDLNFTDGPAERRWIVWLICGFLLLAVLASSCLIIRRIMRRKKTVPVIESDFRELPEAAEDDMEQNGQFTFALGVAV